MKILLNIRITMYVLGKKINYPSQLPISAEYSNSNVSDSTSANVYTEKHWNQSQEEE